jgi:AraC family transcriptional activator of tynA and feaB
VPDVQIHAQMRSTADFTVARIVTTEGRGRWVRDAGEISSDGRDQFVLHISLCGETNLFQLGRHQHVAPGSFAFTASSQPLIQEVSKSGRCESIYFSMPRKFVDRRVAIGEDICLTIQETRHGLHNLVFETIHAFQRNVWSMTDDDFDKSAYDIADLALLALGGSAYVKSADRTERSANLARAKHIIRKRFSDPDLCPTDIARESGLSLYYLHELFRDEGEGHTMRDYLKGVRLQRARELLESSTGKMTITDLALECGFSNISYFSKLFKDTFGLCPRDVLSHASPLS